MYFKIRTEEYIRVEAFYWAFEANSLEEAKWIIESGKAEPTHVFTGNERPALQVKILELTDVTKRVEEIIAENEEYKRNKKDA
jgi:hypothetical protein